MQGDLNVSVLKSDESVSRIISNIIQPLVNYFLIKAKMFDELFFSNNLDLRIISLNNSLNIPFENYGHIAFVLKDYNFLHPILQFNCLYKLIDFKKLESKFDITSIINISFEDKYFKISNRQNVEASLIINDLVTVFGVNNKESNIRVITKLYHENWKPNEMEDFVNGIIKDTMKEIQEKIKANQ